MATVAQEISKVRSKGTSYKTAYLRTVEQNGWIHWILGYSKGSGICTVFVKSPYCPYGEYGTAYFDEVKDLEVDQEFVETPAEVIRRA